MFSSTEYITCVNGEKTVIHRFNETEHHPILYSVPQQFGNSP